MQHSTPDVAAWAAEADQVAAHHTARACAQADVWAREQTYLFELLRTVRDALGNAGGGKMPIILWRRDFVSGHGVRGARGNCANVLRDFLAQHFLILTIDEFNTTKLCPRCHNPTQYANPQREIRSKMCNHEECKSVDRHGNEHDFAYDRDFGAATNMYFVAQFMARAQGRRPVPFRTARQQQQLAENPASDESQ